VAVEAALGTAFDIRFVFNRWTLGDEFCTKVLNMTPERLDAPDFDLLANIGFTKSEIEAANVYCCGAMTLEGAPHITTSISPSSIAPIRAARSANVRSRRQSHSHAGAAQPFISGAISKTINMRTQRR